MNLNESGAFNVVAHLAPPADAASTRTWTKDPFGLRDFVNSFANSKGFTKIPDNNSPKPGALYYNQDSANLVCNLAGFNKAKNIDCASNFDGGRCGWYSPSDNHLAKWNGRNFNIDLASNMGNKWLTTVTCYEPSGGNTGVSECSNGKDDDNDGKIDALIELSINNGETRSWTSSINNSLKNDIRSFVNTEGAKYGYIHVPEYDGDRGRNSMISNDSATANKVCQLAGYSSASYRDSYEFGHPIGRTNFTSPHDNDLAKWNGSNFELVQADEPGLTWLSSLTCTNRLAQCNDGIDNDKDGNIDSADNGCASAQDDDEKEHDPDCTDPNDDDESG
ncbi:MAG: hypothetical protein KAS32_19150, partial [Candidatus Peribacteraceae bacterium]|nr:hypothetical protein [Candidatus Peribacteraceae bacterium]